MKKLLVLLLAAIMVVSLVACGGNNNTVPSTPNSGNNGDVIDEEARYGGHLNLCIYNNPKNLDPAKSTGVWHYLWTSLIYEAPLTRDAEGNIRPNVCDFELSEDQLTLKLWVREGVTFHDGSAVEIEDVIASIKRTVHSSPKKFVEPFIKEIVVDENQVATITFTEYNEKTLYYIACVNPFIGVMPKENAERFSEDNGEIITEVEDAIGTGPYKVSDFENSVKVELVRYEGYKPVEGDYTGFAAPKKAYMDSITINANTEAATSTLALINGDLDVFSGVSSDFADQVAAAGLKELVKPATTGSTLQFNTFGGSIVNTSADMRKAIVAALNLDQLVSFMSEGKVTKAGACPVYGEEYYVDYFEKADYMGPANIALSKEYQQKAGYNGETLEWVMPNSYDDIATMCEKWLKDAGITVKIRMVDSATWSEINGDPAGDWLFTYTSPSLNETPTLLSTNLMETNYNSEVKDELYEALQGMEVGSDEYMAKWHELAKQMVDDCPTVYLHSGNMTWTCNPDLIWDYDGRNIYFHNAYWANPSDHEQ